MTTVYFVRHVQATGNLEQKFQGQIDTDVSEGGKIQMQNLRGLFAGIEIDEIYTSPLKRAVATAQSVKGVKDIPVYTVDGLMEINAGAWEGMLLDDIEKQHPDALEMWRSALWDFRVEGSESGREVYARVGKAFEEILQKTDGKSIAVVSHGCALKNLLCYAEGYQPEEIGKIGWLSNGSVTKMVFDGKVPGTVVYANKHDHIDPDTMLPPVNILKKKREE